jgi:hypothetical protein
MSKPVAILLLGLGLAYGAVGPGRADEEGSVLTFHGAADRSGNFVMPELTMARARGVHRDSHFDGRLTGHLYAQPLYWRDAATGAGMILAATASNVVQALDAATGRQLWSRSLGPSVDRGALRCGNISPLGVTGTPVIDPQTRAIYVAAAIGGDRGVRHLLFALALADGTPLAGWPIDVAEALRQRGRAFNARDQNQRGALTILDGHLFVPYGGHYGDCGDYHGWVVGVALREPHSIGAFATPARGGGIWAPGGIGSDGASLFVATGNTIGARAWMGGEAVLRLAPDLQPPSEGRDYFAPENWRELDARDADLGGSNPLVIAGDATRRTLVLALGKDGHAYLLDKGNLGGIGGSLLNTAVSPHAIMTAPATYPASGAAFVAFRGPGSRCPGGRPMGDLTVLKVSGDPPALATAWCAAARGAGSPIITTTDGHADPVVWFLGAEGDNRLHAFRGDTGEPLLSAGATDEAMAGLRHFQSPIAAAGRLYVGADERIYAFAF